MYYSHSFSLISLSFSFPPSLPFSFFFFFASTFFRQHVHTHTCTRTQTHTSKSYSQDITPLSLPLFFSQTVSPFSVPVLPGTYMAKACEAAFVTWYRQGVNLCLSSLPVFTTDKRFADQQTQGRSVFPSLDLRLTEWLLGRDWFLFLSYPSHGTKRILCSSLLTRACSNLSSALPISHLGFLSFLKQTQNSQDGFAFRT